MIKGKARDLKNPLITSPTFQIHGRVRIKILSREYYTTNQRKKIDFPLEKTFLSKNI